MGEPLALAITPSLLNRQNRFQHAIDMENNQYEPTLYTVSAMINC